MLIGALGYAQAKYGLKTRFVVALSDHIHLLFRGDAPETVKAFFCLANSQMSKEVQHLCGWTGGIFRRRFKVSKVSHEPEAQIARLK